MKWKYSYFAYAMLFLWCALSLSCGVKKKTIQRSEVDSTRYSKDLSRETVTQNTTKVTNEFTVFDNSQFKTVETFYDTAGRKTREITFEGRQSRETASKTDSLASDSTGLKETVKIDSSKVVKEEMKLNKDSDTSLLKNVGSWTMIACFAIAVIVFFIYRWIKRETPL